MPRRTASACCVRRRSERNRRTVRPISARAIIYILYRFAGCVGEANHRIARHSGRFGLHFAPAMSIIHALRATGAAGASQCTSTAHAPRCRSATRPFRRHPPRLHAQQDVAAPVRPLPHPSHSGRDGRDAAVAAAEDRALRADARRAHRQPGGAAGEGGTAGDLPVRLAGRGRCQHRRPDVSGPVAVSGGIPCRTSCGGSTTRCAAPTRSRMPRATTAPTGWRRSSPTPRQGSAAR